MKLRVVVLLMAGMLAVGWLGLASNLRGPIVILGNADFTEDNGVVAGSGSIDDPYIIAGWEIEVPEEAHYGVRIENVTARFELRGLVIKYAYEMTGAAIRIGFAEGGRIRACMIFDSMNGIDVTHSTDIRIEETLIYTVGRGLRVVGDMPEHYRHQIAKTTEHNDLPVHYYYGLDGDSIRDVLTRHLTVANSRNVTISNNEIVNGDGLLLAFVEDSTVRHNVAHRLSNVITEHGIHLVRSSGNELYENVVKNNRLAGIQLTHSHRNVIRDNFGQVNDTDIRLVDSSENTIRANELYRSVTGIALLGGTSNTWVHGNVIIDDVGGRLAEGVVLEQASENRIEENLIARSEIGIIVEVWAEKNVFTANTVVSCGYGIAITGSNNTFERNLITQHEYGVLFIETFARSVTRGNVFVGNVLADNLVHHLYTSKDSTENRFSDNAFFNTGVSQVNDGGERNAWTIDGVGNFWGVGSVIDSTGDGIGDAPVTVFPSAVDDMAPLASVSAGSLGLGILGTLPEQTITIKASDGKQVDVAALIAESPHARITGFRGFPHELIEGFLGVLFVFDRAVEGGFTMDTVPFDLDIAFFTPEGDWAGGRTMTAMSRDIVRAGAPYQYALELPAGSLERLGIGTGSRLVLP